MGSRTVALFAGLGIFAVIFTFIQLPSYITQNEDPMTKIGWWFGLIASWLIIVIIMKLILKILRNKIFTDPKYAKVSKQFEYDRDEA